MTVISRPRTRSSRPRAVPDVRVGPRSTNEALTRVIAALGETIASTVLPHTTPAVEVSTAAAQPRCPRSVALVVFLTVPLNTSRVLS